MRSAGAAPCGALHVHVTVPSAYSPDRFVTCGGAAPSASSGLVEALVVSCSGAMRVKDPSPRSMPTARPAAITAASSAKITPATGLIPRFDEEDSSTTRRSEASSASEERSIFHESATASTPPEPAPPSKEYEDERRRVLSGSMTGAPRRRVFWSPAAGAAEALERFSLISISVRGRPSSCWTRCSPCPNSIAEGVRSCGSTAIAARNTRSSSAGASARPRPRIRPRCTRLAIDAAELSPIGSSKGLRPVINVHVVEASAHTSCKGEAGEFTSCCSGGAHSTEKPSNAPTSRRPTFEATPKSASTGFPYASSMIFDGLMSRCT